MRAIVEVSRRTGRIDLGNGPKKWGDLQVNGHDWYARRMNIADYADNLRVSSHMGKVVAICVVLILVTIVIKAIWGKKK